MRLTIFFLNVCCFSEYLLADFRETCYSEKWYAFVVLAILVIVFYCIVYPLAILSILWNIRHKLETLVVQHKYGFLYDEYKLHSWWWEPFSIFRKFLLASVPVFLYAFPTLQLVMSIFISMIWHLFHATFNPYVLVQANILQHITYFGSWVTLFLLLLQETFRRKGYMTAHEGIVTSIIVLNVLILIGAMVIIVWSIWSEMNDINKKLNSAIRDKVDINISKKLSNNVKNKLSKLARSSKAHVKARQLEIKAEEARHAADQHGGNHSKRWGKLSVLTKLGGLRRAEGRGNNLHQTHIHVKEEEAGSHADRLEKEAMVSHRKRQKTMVGKRVKGREKIMERLKGKKT